MGSAITGADASGTVIARAAELDAITGFIDARDAGVRAVLLNGEAGIGKTTLWEYGIDVARRRGYRVLVVRTSGPETSHSFAGLIDLFNGLGSEELASIPAPQRRALDVALYRADPSGPPPGAQVISLAVLSALRAMAADTRLLLAVDDLQWLDAASEDALAYAARRLTGESVSFLMTRRPGSRGALERAFVDAQAHQVAVDPIGPSAIRQILANRLGLRLSRQQLRRLYDVTLGNPFFALEVGRLLAARGAVSLDEDVPIPDDIEELLGLRLADLGEPAQLVLLALALDADLRVAQVHALAGEAALDAAIDASVVVVDGDRVRAAHPLLAAAAKGRAEGAAVRDLHARLADVVIDGQRRALHLARSAVERDGVISELLAGAADRAAAHGDSRLAVELSTHALRLSSAGSSVEPERLLALARHLYDAGEQTRLTELLTPRLDTLPPGRPRATAYLLLAGGRVAGNHEIVELLNRAVIEAGDHQSTRGVALSILATNEAVIEVRDIAGANMKASAAVTATEAEGGDDLGSALFSLAWTQALLGRPVAPVTARFDAMPGARTLLGGHPGRVEGQRHAWRGELEAARARIESFNAEAVERGETEGQALARLHLCELELRAGRWAEADALLSEWATTTEGDVLLWPMYERCHGLLAAGRGDVAAARQWAGRAVERAEATGVRWDWLEAKRALGQAELLAKDATAAAAHLRPVWQHTTTEGVLEPGAFPVAPDLVEALVELGEYDEAREVVSLLVTAAEAQDHPWARLSARRAEGGVLLAERYQADVAHVLGETAAAYSELGLDFDAARVWLAVGRAARRARKWGVARTMLDQAAAAFDVIGSPGWGLDTRGELDRVGARRPSADGALTYAEQRVAHLAADGLTNRQIARSLVVTVSTVEFHLSNVYAKLAIRSRAQLAARLARDPTPDQTLG